MAEKLKAALEAGDDEQLLQLCQQLDTNLTLKVDNVEQSVTHHVTCKSRKLDCLKLLIDKFGQDCLISKNSDGNTTVHCAALHQDETWMQLIYDRLGKDCFLERGRLQKTAAHFAAENTRDNSALKWLVKVVGKDCLSVVDKHGNTAVHLAAQFQGADSMELMKSVLGSACFNLQGRGQRTAIHWAAVNKISNAALKWLVKECGPELVTMRDKDENTVNHLAATFQRSDSLEILKQEFGLASFRQVGRLKRSVFHCAAVNKVSDDNLNWLVQQFGPAGLTVKDQDGNTAIHLAAKIQGADSMKLVNSVLSVDSFYLLGRNQRTALHNAALNEVSNEALNCLVRLCAHEKLTNKDENGNTVIHLAAQFRSSDSMVQIKEALGVSSLCKDSLHSAQPFIEKGANNWTAVHFAAQNTNSNSVLAWCVEELGPTCLLEKDSSGATPCHLAAQHQGVESLIVIAKVLGVCCLTLKDSNGKTVAEHAASNQKKDKILQWIEEYWKLFRSKPDAMRQEELRLQELMRSMNGDKSAAKPSDTSLPSTDSLNFILENGERKPIGEGSFGQVYKVLTDTYQTQAVKIIPMTSVDRQRQEEVIELERKGIEILKSIRHPNILQFIKCQRMANGDFCIFTELISGESLYDLMTRQRMPFTEPGVKNFSQQICSALNYLHCHKPVIIHRDIKCSNIMLTVEGGIKLIDFGLAKEIQSASAMHMTANLCGTWYFMSPELFMATDIVIYTPKTDVWAFGCTVFEMLTMSPPNRHLGEHEVAMAVVNREFPQLPPEFSASLRDFYSRCVDKNPDERADMAQLLGHRFLAA